MRLVESQSERKSNNNTMTNVPPPSIAFVKNFISFRKLVFDTQSGGDVKTLFASTDGSIIPKGCGAIFVVEFPSGEVAAGYTTKYNDAPYHTGLPWGLPSG